MSGYLSRRVFLKSDSMMPGATAAAGALPLTGQAAEAQTAPRAGEDFSRDISPDAMPRPGHRHAPARPCCNPCFGKVRHHQPFRKAHHAYQRAAQQIGGLRLRGNQRRRARGAGLGYPAATGIPAIAQASIDMVFTCPQYKIRLWQNASPAAQVCVGLNT